MIISLDTETNGLDFVHGAMPFFVTSCDDRGVIRFWEWQVDPYTRKPDVLADDVAEIVELLEAADTIYLHNAKFDCRALATIGIMLPWEKARDTLVMSHLLASNHRHDLTSVCMEYLGVNIEPHELFVKEVVQACRAIARKEYPEWMIAEEGLPCMPSIKPSSNRDEDKPWKNDMWLPRAMGLVHDPTRMPNGWATACARYANADSEHTLPLGIHLEEQIRRRGYWSVYDKHRTRLPQVACEMESYGVSAVGRYVENTVTEYEEYIAEAESAMVHIAAGFGHKLELGKNGSLNDNTRDFFYGSVEQICPRCGYSKRLKHWNGEGVSDWWNTQTCPKCIKPTGRGKNKKEGTSQLLSRRSKTNLGLKVITSKKTGNATLDADAMKEYLATLGDSPALEFIEIFADKHMYDTALTYMHAYQRFWVPIPGEAGYYRIHPSLNPCGTDHLRWSSSNPNMQNVSGESKELSNRMCFGPAPGREWWSMDFKSIERRIPAYESGEPKMVAVFERPNEPPYWGNLYCLTASVLYPDEYWPLADTEGAFREKYPRLYKQAKFFDLAKQYGAGRAKGDLLSRVKNSYSLVDNEFPLLAALQRKYLRDAEVNGVVETIPDRSVDPARGYPLLPSRTEEGRVLSTTPFNYHVSGTACWCKNTALIRCADQCAEWREDGFDARVVLEVHDDLLFDFPRGRTMEKNLPRAMVLKGLMEQAGEDLVIRVPTPVSVKYHSENWAKGIDVTHETGRSTAINSAGRIQLPGDPANMGAMSAGV